jgi:predicted acyl esterase
MGSNRRQRRNVLFAGVITALVGALSAIGVTTAGATPPPTFDARGSAEQVYVTGLTAGEQVSLLDDGGATVATQTANPLGGSLFRNVPPGSGYRVQAVDDGSESDPITVHSDAAAPWDPTTYDQTIASSGYQYLATRDGTKLAINVHPPMNNANPTGNTPVPTLIEYSGYGYADPGGAESSIGRIANLMGYAVVDVNMRGTGCSGGAFDYFETLQQLDGYDVIETIAKQPWVLNGKVGMFGISYGGISQLFTAQVNPPSLAAITPLSVIDATASTLYPGGILNTGFALSWAQSRVHDAEPAGPDTGQKWAWDQIQGGDTICEANQALHGDAVNLIAKIEANSHYDPAVADPLDPVSFVDKIHVPVFLACQWQDEQTGGHCPSMVQNMTGTDEKWFTFTNGAHIDSVDPATLNHLFDFLELYVAKRAPSLDNALMRAVSALIYQEAMGVPSDTNITLPHDPIQDETTYAGALAAFKALPEVTVRFDNGAGTSPTGDTTPGNPYAGFDKTFSTLPVPGTEARTWYFGPDGTLGALPQTSGGIDTYTSDPSAMPLTDFGDHTGGGGLWGNASQWNWDWQQNPAGNAVSYETAPLVQDTTVVGTGGVHLWVKSSTPDVDLQATISEVRPDGKETFVQNGWLRASERKISTGTDNYVKQPSSLVSPIPSFTQADSAPMPADQFVEVSIPLYYQGHAYRPGSRIRVTISAPGGTQPVWEFSQTEPSTGTAQVSLAYTSSMPSSLVLPVVPDVTIPTPLPACPSLRSQPCRTYQAFTNQSTALPPTTTSTTSSSSTTSVAPTTSVAGAAETSPPTTPPSSPSPQDNGMLALTGANVLGLLAVGFALVLIGLALARRARLRRSAS